MKHLLFASLVLSLTLAAAVAWGQTQFYCVKPDGAPVAAIVMPYGSNHDPSVVCNAAVPQCFLTCSAVQRLPAGGQATPPPDVPTVAVTPQMLSNFGAPAAETPEACDRQYQACVAKCRGDRACVAYCQSVRSGCGTASRGQ